MHWSYVLFAFLSGCGASHSTITAPQANAEQREATCQSQIARYREILSSASNVCVSDVDCAVYGGLDPDAICGGLTDIETARALRAVSDAATEAGCPRPGYSCPAIEIHCRQGVCL